MRVAVVFGPLRVSTDFVDYPYFADLGAVQAAAVLASAGWEVALVDGFALPSSTLRDDRDAGYLRLGATVEEIAARVPASDLIVVAYTPFHRPPARDTALAELLSSLRARHAGPILLADLYQSGQHYVDAPVAAVRAAYPEVDHYLKYECEAAIDAVGCALVDGRMPPSGSGEPARLDDLPLPAWHLVDTAALFHFHAQVARLRPRWAFPFDAHSLPMLTSRGCPYRCAHCSSNPGLAAGRPKTQRRYSLAYLERAVVALRERGAARVHLLDELANVDEAHFDGLLALLQRNNFAFEIPNGVRADYLEPRHFAAMKGRVTTVSVSAESGVQRVIDEVVGKRLDLATIHRAAVEAARAGVPLLVHFIIGMPGETRAEINRTLEYAAGLAEEHGVEPAVQFATPLPGTRLHAEAERRHLPTVAEDYGPRFQKLPTLVDPGLPADDLIALRASFDRRLNAARQPEKLILNVTYRCNNKCSFCAVGTRDQYDGDLGMQREHLARWHARGVRLVDFDGGEPTLHEGLLALVGYARAIGYRRINVTSNGRRLVYPDYAKALVSSGLTSLLISIHGPDRATHAREVMVYEAFDQSTEGLRNACAARDAAGLPVEIGVNITLTEGNYRRLGEVAELALTAGAPWLNVQFLTPFGRATSRTAPDTTDAARVTREVILAYRDRMRIQVINLPKCFLPDLDAHCEGDVGKLDRRMVFVNNDDVNLARYLAERRVKKPVCEPCVHSVACGGFYELGDSPEPPWKIEPEELTRPLSLPMLRAR
ncbi:MAG: radical SAM protein [Myxococcales bacterium]|nr:radical SAM protein [Myxococcales bacterium]